MLNRRDFLHQGAFGASVLLLTTKLGRVVNEWGPWYRPGSEATPGDLLEQMPTMQDAVFSGMTLDIFNRHPEKVAMAN